MFVQKLLFLYRISSIDFTSFVEICLVTLDVNETHLDAVKQSQQR